MADPVTLPGTLPGILDGWCGPIEWAVMDAPGGPRWRRGVWGPVGESSGPEQMGIVRAGDMRGDVQIQLPMDRPECMCRAARWLAERLGVDPGATAPLWYSVEESSGDVYWFLKTTNARGEVYGHGFFVDTKDPAEALRLACLAVGGA